MVSCSCAFGAGADVQVFTDRAAWEAAVSGSVTTETFDTDMADAGSLAFGTGVQSDANEPLGASLIHNVSGGAFSARIRNASGTNGYRSIDWTLPAATNAFGCDFTSISSSRGVDISADFDGSGVQAFDLFAHFGNGSSGGFFGIVSDGSFASVRLSASGTGDNDFFGADDLSFVAGEACVCDTDGGGVLNVDDIDGFVAGFIGQTAVGDCTADGVWNVDDVECFVACFLAGCG